TLSFSFSSRRRHTRWPRDWSSDVCSSDLVAVRRRIPLGRHRLDERGRHLQLLRLDADGRGGLLRDVELRQRLQLIVVAQQEKHEIGRASCRERGELWVVVVV